MASAGGHLAELEFVLPAFAGQHVSLLTYRSPRGAEPIPGLSTYLVDNIGTSPYRLARALPTILQVFFRERPDVVVSTGSEIAIPVFLIAAVVGVRRVFIESWCRVRTASGTGRIVYSISDRFFVQWQPLLDVYGSKAEYAGRIM